LELLRTRGVAAALPWAVGAGLALVASATARVGTADVGTTPPYSSSRPGGSDTQDPPPALACVWRETTADAAADACVLDADPNTNYGASHFL
jgi:hypothetical protein